MESQADGFVFQADETCCLETLVQLMSPCLFFGVGGIIVVISRDVEDGRLFGQGG